MMPNKMKRLMTTLAASLLSGLLLAACADPEVAGDGGSTDSTPADGMAMDLGLWPDQPQGGPDIGKPDWKLYAHDQTTLVVIDPLTLGSKPPMTKVGKFTFDASIPINERSINDIAITPDDKLYAVSKTYLYRVDPLTAKLTKITEVRDKSSQKPPPNVALTFEKSGRLLASDIDGALRRIHYTGTSKGLVEDIGSYGNSQGSSGDLVAILDGTVYGVSQKGSGATETNNKLIQVDTKTGKATPIGSIGHGYVWGLAYWAGVIYGFTNEYKTKPGTGKLLKIDPLTGKGTLLMEYPYYPYSFWGAAVTPLAPIK